MKKELIQNLKRLIGQKLNLIKFACQMIMLDFGKDAIHCQALTRISKNDDILFTTFDYQTWDQKESENNDEYYFFEKYKDEIVNGVVTDIKVSNTNDLIIEFDNGVKIEVFIANGYNHCDEENEQWCLLINVMEKHSKHYAVYNKNIEFYDLLEE